MALSYFERVRPFYIENWPERLYQRTVPQANLVLSVPELQALVDSQYASMGDDAASDRCCLPEHHAIIGALVLKLDEMVRKFPGGAFVRLGSRSPKDGFHGIDGGSAKVTDGSSAVLRLGFGESERMTDDLQLALIQRYAANVWVRAWKDIEPLQEWRCFRRERKWVGVSQYHYRDSFPANQDMRSICWAIESYLGMIGPDLGAALPDAVVDLVVRRLTTRASGGAYEVYLLEINPMFEMTDPCLFSWKDGGDFDDTMRYMVGKELVKRDLFDAPALHDVCPERDADVSAV
jgi:hypothetical protein